MTVARALRSKFLLTVVLLPAFLAGGNSHSSENTPALWRLSDTNTTIYLYGTLHATKPGRAWYADNAAEAFEASDTVYLEVGKNTPGPEVRRILKERAYNADGVSLSGYLSEDEEALVQQAVLKNGVSWKALQTMKPWYAALTLGKAELAQRDVDTATGVEAFLVNEAAQGDKRLRGLVSFDTQMSYLADLPIEVQVHYLMHTLKESDEKPDQFDALYEAWLAGDVETVSDIVIGDYPETIPEVYTVLMKDRNGYWAEILDGLMRKQSGTFFVAVGVGHLVGPDRLQGMLTERGYEIVRVY